MSRSEDTLNTAVRRAWAAPPTRYGTAMLRRFGWFYHALGFGRMFGRIRLSEESVQRIRLAAGSGPVVYVLPRQNTIDHLVLNTVLNQRRLPLSVWSNGATAFFWQPVGAAWRDLLHRVRSWFREGAAPDPLASGWVATRLQQGDAISVFLDGGPGIVDRVLGRPHLDALDALIAFQATLPDPIQLVPAHVVWSRAPELAGNVVRDFLTGARESEGPISMAARIYLRSRDTLVQVGEPVDLRAFNERIRPERRSSALHALLRRYLNRESRVVRGPALLPRPIMRQLVLDNPPMRELARREAAATAVPYDKIRRKMNREFDAIAAHFSWSFILVLSVVLRPLWTRVFSGVDVRQEDVERIRDALRGGSAVLVPCHKSHLDYVLLSWVFYSHDLIVPHVIAGNNLAIWPLSVALRSAGGFFIKRSFAGDRIHPAVFSRYLRELILQGYPVEFFIEGGRTRSGKLLRPKHGVLGMVLDAAEVRPTGREVTLLPIALAYEQVAEERAYARELGGEKKEPETMGAFVRSTSILGRRYGRVYLRVGTPVPCSELVDANPAAPIWSERPEADRKTTLRVTADTIIHRIGEVMVVLPTSLVAASLLAHHRRGIAHADLVARALRLRVFLQQQGAPEAASLQHWDRAIDRVLDQMTRAGRLERLESSQGPVWSVVPEQRIYLAFHQNQLMHYAALAGYGALVLRATGAEDVDVDALAEPFGTLVQLLRREFVFDPKLGPSELLNRGLDHLAAHGGITRRDGRVSITDTERLGEMHGLIRSLVESYRLIASEGQHLVGAHMTESDWPAALQAQRDALLATGKVTRPESLSMVSLQNAIRTLIEDGALLKRGDHLEPAPHAIAALLALLAPMVD